MSDVPDYLILKRHRDLHGLHARPWPRWIVLSLIVLFAILALFNVFGQRPATTTVTGGGATLKLYAPDNLRGGLLFSARFHVTAHRDLKNAILILDPGWVEGMSVNTVEPSPLGEGSSDGRLTLQLGHIAKDHDYILWMQFQVNPTNVAWNRPAGVTLADGSTVLTHINRTLRIYP